MSLALVPWSWSWVRGHWNWKSVKSKGSLTTTTFLLITLLILVTQLSHLSQALILHIPKTPDRKLNVDYFEPVFYDPAHLLSKRRVRREIGHKEPLKFTLTSKSRDFHLHLEPDTGVFHPSVVLENSQGPFSYDTSRLFHGHLEDEPGSRAEGLITSQGHFDGVVRTSSGQEFHIEPANRYADSSGDSSGWPGIVYERESIQWPREPPICASHKLYMDVNTRQTEKETPTPTTTTTTNQGQPIDVDIKINIDNQNQSHSHFANANPLHRRKRYIIEPRRKTCMLYLQADHLFMRHLGTEEAALNMMARHIQRVNEIYRATDFDGDGLPDGISFMIKRIKVHSENATLQPDYKYNGDFQVIKFLERFSEGDYESFCLAYMFTFRDFEGGTLGLAWTGDLKNAGGVCERKGHFRGGLKSLNTGIITLLNYGKIVLPAVSYVTLAHEVGHNFGSPHDPESERECVPGGRDGNFIMYARATAGDQKNNQRFSPCSLRSILPVLNSKARNIHGCFSEPQRGICGNREVEDGEECDCGWEEDCKEDCCWPMRLKYSKGEVPCTLRPSRECSPSQGPCCTASCTLKAGDKCRDDNGCRHSAYCDALNPVCPPSVHKPNRTVCHEEQNVCFMGECTGSICLAYGLESCQCSPQPWDSSSKLCELCCKQPGEGQPCISSFEFNDVPFDVPDLFAKPGSPCKNYTGYCDAYHSCREVDPSGPLATLRNLLLADEGLTAIAHWIDTHWYAVISFVALFILMMVLTAKLCGKQAKRKLRAITVLHSNVDAIQVERSYWDESGQHVVHPAAVRKKIPLRKKIRDKKKSKRGKNRGGGGVENGVGVAGPSGGSGGGGGESNGAASSSKGPRYGTLWRKRRERNRAPLQKTEQQQSFDLVQLDTPNPMASNANVLYPDISGGAMAPPLLPTSSSATNSGGGVGLETAGPSGSSGAHLNHLYEAKTAILPSAGRKKRFGFGIHSSPVL